MRGMMTAGLAALFVAAGAQAADVTHVYVKDQGDGRYLFDVTIRHDLDPPLVYSGPLEAPAVGPRRLLGPIDRYARPSLLPATVPWGVAPQHDGDYYEIADAGGAVIARVPLLSPHVNDTPYSRDLQSVRIPSGVRAVTVRAVDQTTGPGRTAVTIPLPADDEDR